MIWCEYNNIKLNNLITYGFLIFCGLFSCGAAIQCWECNSKTDPGCSDPFKGYSLGSVNCSQINGNVDHLRGKNGKSLEASICRKTVQTVEEEVRIIRGCGWVQNDEKLKSRDCFNRVGTMGNMQEVQSNNSLEPSSSGEVANFDSKITLACVSVYHCTCNTDGCNGLQKMMSSFSTIFSLLIITFTSYLINYKI